MKIVKFEIDDSMSPEVFAHVRIDMGDRRILDIPKLKLFSYTHYVTVICASEKRELTVGPNHFELPKSKNIIVKDYGKLTGARLIPFVHSHGLVTFDLLWTAGGENQVNRLTNVVFFNPRKQDIDIGNLCYGDMYLCIGNNEFNIERFRNGGQKYSSDDFYTILKR